MDENCFTNTFSNMPIGVAPGVGLMVFQTFNLEQRLGLSKQEACTSVS